MSSHKWFSIHARGEAAAEIDIFDEIGGWGITAAQFARDLKAHGDVGQITLNVHSPGGSIFEGLALYNILRNHPARIVANVRGLAASMASVVIQAADEIRIPANAYMMIHKPWSGTMGDADEMRKTADLLDKLEDTLVDIYASRSTLDRDDIKQMLAAETWLDGTEAVAHGFADTTTAAIQAAAKIDHGIMAAAPDALTALTAHVQPNITEFPEDEEADPAEPEAPEAPETPESAPEETPDDPADDAPATPEQASGFIDRILAKLHGGVDAARAETAKAQAALAEANARADALAKQINDLAAERDALKQSLDNEVAKVTDIITKEQARFAERLASFGIPIAELPASVPDASDEAAAELKRIEAGFDAIRDSRERAVVAKRIISLRRQLTASTGDN